jgi:methionyl-tRNA formyltransferase
VPVAWAIRNGDEEVGVTVHRMDAELDTGPIFAQVSMPIGDYTAPDDFYARMGPVLMGAMGEALERLAAGEEGTAQVEGGEYESFLPDDEAWLDPARPAVEMHRRVWAWRFTIPVSERGALLDLDGETVRVLASSLTEVEGARRFDCADAPLWLVEIEPAQAAETTGSATSSS